jgi:hypothetical protein
MCLFVLFASVVAHFSSKDLLCNDAWADAADILLTPSCKLENRRDRFRSLNVVVIFAEQNYVSRCAPQLLVNKSIILVSSNNGDYCAPSGSGAPKLTSLLENPFLVAWYSTNVALSHPKLHALPLGPKVQWGSRVFHGEEPSKRDLLRMLQVHGKENFADTNRPNLLVPGGMNAGTADRPMCSVLSAGQTRRDAAAYFANYTTSALDCDGANYLNFTFDDNEHRMQQAYFKRLRCAKFVVAPQGNGIDTHRVWEALYMGAIPIVIDFPPMRTAYARLPILLVNSWSDVTEAMLADKFVDMHTQIEEYEWSRLGAARWRRDIAETAAFSAVVV